MVDEDALKDRHEALIAARGLGLIHQQQPTHIGKDLHLEHPVWRSDACVRATLAIIDRAGPKYSFGPAHKHTQRGVQHSLSAVCLHEGEYKGETYRELTLAMGVDLSTAPYEDIEIQLNVARENLPGSLRWVRATEEFPYVAPDGQPSWLANPIGQRNVMVSGLEAGGVAAELLQQRSPELPSVRVRGARSDLRMFRKAADQLRIPSSMWEESKIKSARFRK